MHSTLRAHTAKIYQFPSYRRAAVEQQRAETLQHTMRRPVVDTGAWYHQAAIEASTPASKS